MGKPVPCSSQGHLPGFPLKRQISMQSSAPITAVGPENSRRMGRSVLKLLCMVSLALLATSLACNWFQHSDATSSSLIEKGKADYAARRYSDAENKFHKAIEIHSTAEAHYWLGLALRDSGRRDEA